jgi:hypothetical protein
MMSGLTKGQDFLTSPVLPVFRSSPRACHLFCSDLDHQDHELRQGMTVDLRFMPKPR